MPIKFIIYNFPVSSNLCWAIPSAVTRNNFHSTGMAINTAGKSVFSPTHWVPFTIYVQPRAHRGITTINIQPRVMELLDHTFLHILSAWRVWDLPGKNLEQDFSPSLSVVSSKYLPLLSYLEDNSSQKILFLVHGSFHDLVCSFLFFVF